MKFCKLSVRVRVRT